jgi:hypothetical protein
MYARIFADRQVPGRHVMDRTFRGPRFAYAKVVGLTDLAMEREEMGASLALGAPGAGSVALAPERGAVLAGRLVVADRAAGGDPAGRAAGNGVAAGDILAINLAKKSVHLHLGDADRVKRRQNYQMPKTEFGFGALCRYAQVAGEAVSCGCAASRRFGRSQCLC